MCPKKLLLNSAIIDTDIEKIIVVSYMGIDQYEKSKKIQFYDELISTSK